MLLVEEMSRLSCTRTVFEVVWNLPHWPKFRCCQRRKNHRVGPVNMRVKINSRKRESDEVYLFYFETLWLEIWHACSWNILLFLGPADYIYIKPTFLGVWSDWVVFNLGKTWTPFFIWVLWYDTIRTQNGLSPCDREVYFVQSCV